MSTPRAGKYCPQCHTMTFVDRDICENCGHRFRSGIIAPTAEPDPLHRTMQFTLPPLPTRLPETPAPTVSAPSPPRSRRRPGIILALLLSMAGVALLTGGLFLWHPYTLTPPEASASSPVGTWESETSGSSPAAARLTFVFGADGTGKLSWQQVNPGAGAAVMGQTPLRWHLDETGALVLAITPPNPMDAASATIGIFNSHPWLWSVNHARGRLVLGRLIFTEKK